MFKLYPNVQFSYFDMVTKLCLKHRLLAFMLRSRSSPCLPKKKALTCPVMDGVYKLSVPCVSCYASGINDEGRNEIVEGIDVQTWLTGKVSDVVTDSINLKDVADIPIFNRIRELNKLEMMAIYQFLEENNYIAKVLMSGFNLLYKKFNR